MIGVRLVSRGSGASPQAPARLRVALAALVAALVLAGEARSQERESRFRPAGTARIDRSIRQTASPLADADDPTFPDAPSKSKKPARERLTGPDPEIEKITEPLADVLIEGNQTIAVDEIIKKIKTRPGRMPDPKLVKEDIAALYRTRWFVNVETRVSSNDKGPVLIFRVWERPILKNVEYKGNKGIKTKELAALTNLKPGGAFDVGANKEAARRIESHYFEKAFVFCKVELEKGGDPKDREVIFKIDEGPKVHVDKISFSGNKAIKSEVLKTQLKTKKRFLWLIGGKFDPASIPEDIASLKQYYHNQGFFDVKISYQRGLSENKARVHLEYEIDEGVQFKVRNVSFVGNRVLSDEQLRANLKMLPGQFYNQRFVNADVEKITSQYGELGRIFARIEPVQRTFEQPGELDLVYEIGEDRPWKIGRIHVHIEGEHPHTKESVVLERLQFKPGDLASLDTIKKSEQRLRNSQIFAGAIPGSPGPNIVVEPVNQPAPRGKKYDVARGQDGDEVVRAQNQSFPSFDAPPGSPRFDEPPIDGEPPWFGEQAPGFIEPHVYVQETQTGRLSFGVGFNSNAGVVGNIVLEENNFDIARVPTSWQDVLDGTAWRGDGQQLRIEAIPGNQLSRYLISWRDPYFLEQDVSLGVSGFYYQRFFPNWFEQREGGRVTVGRQFTPTLSGSLAARIENVEISQPPSFVPPQLQEVLGNNFFTSVTASVAHDTRDSTFIPGKGHYIEASFEQGIADFVYPKAILDARQYFTLRERPDGGNRHIVSVSGQVGYADNGVPIFEKFYAGGFQSFRGFQFYGVTPRVGGVRIGGRFQALGSVEYMVPVTADDTIQLVAFTDMGTVDDQVTLDRFRLTAGGGIRLTIPAMGPVPIALDFAAPILRQDFDTPQIFAFYMGVLR
jgi:outer membrane protein insertion porin family